MSQRERESNISFTAVAIEVFRHLILKYKHKRRKKAYESM